MIGSYLLFGESTDGSRSTVHFPVCGMQSEFKQTMSNRGDFFRTSYHYGLQKLASHFKILI